MTPVRIKQGLEGAGKEGKLYGTVEVAGRIWAIVVFTGDDEPPTMFKADGLEIGSVQWLPLAGSTGGSRKPEPGVELEEW